MWEGSKLNFKVIRTHIHKLSKSITDLNKLFKPRANSGTEQKRKTQYENKQSTRNTIKEVMNTTNEQQRANQH